MEKIIKKILDNYYKNILINKILDLKFFNGLDFKIVEEKEGFTLQVKKREYKDELYTTVAYFGKNRYLCYIVDFEKVADEIEEHINKYEKIKY